MFPMATNPRGDLDVGTALFLPLKEIPFQWNHSRKNYIYMLLIRNSQLGSTSPAPFSCFDSVCDWLLPSSLWEQTINFKLANQSHHRAVPSFSLHGLALPALLDQKKEPFVSPQHLHISLHGTLAIILRDSIKVWGFFRAIEGQIPFKCHLKWCNPRPHEVGSL